MKREESVQKIGLPAIGIPGQVLFHPDLTHTEMILFGFLQMLAHTDDGCCWSTNKHLSNLILRDKKTIQRATKSLEELGFIKVESSKAITSRRVHRRIFIDPTYTKKYIKMALRHSDRVTGKNALEEYEAVEDEYEFIEEEDLQKLGVWVIGIPGEVLFHPELTQAEKILFGFLKCLSCSEDGCYASNFYLGNLIKMDEHNISKSIKKLKELGFLETFYSIKEEGGTHRNIFINYSFGKEYNEMCAKYSSLITEGKAAELERRKMMEEIPQMNPHVWNEFIDREQKNYQRESKNKKSFRRRNSPVNRNRR